VLAGWRYLPSGTRDLRLDLLRGWCIFSMVVDHAAGDRTSALFVITGNGTLPMTGAHGFVMISGVVIGSVYGAIARSRGFREMLRRLGGRAAKLYVVAVVLGLLDLAAGLLPGAAGPTSFDLAALPGLLTLTHGSDELMTFYLMLLAIAAVGLWLLAHGQAGLLLALGVGAWLAHQYEPTWLNPPLVYFAPLADWQLLFVIGLVLGHERARLAAWLTGTRRRAYLVLLFTLLAVLFAVQVAVVGGFSSDAPSWMDAIAEQAWTDYDHNPPLHMLALLTYFLGIFHLVDWLWVPARRVIGWFFIPLGQAALYVYAVHTVLVFYVLAGLALFQELDGPLLALSLLALMGVLWVMVKRRFLFAIIPR
jgi:hypothetical protein